MYFYLKSTWNGDKFAFVRPGTSDDGKLVVVGYQPSDGAAASKLCLTPEQFLELLRVMQCAEQFVKVLMVDAALATIEGER